MSNQQTDQSKWKRIRSTELCSLAILALLVLVLIAFEVLSWKTGLNRQGSVPYYLLLVFTPVGKGLLFALMLYLIACIIRMSVWLLIMLRRNKDPRHHIRSIWNTLRRLYGEIKPLVRVFVPPTLSLFVGASIIGIFDAMNVGRLADSVVLGWDKALTGTYPFIFWTSVSYPEWFLAPVIFSFQWLPVIILAFSFYLFRFHRNLMYEFAAAISLSIVIMLPFWYAIPVMSPHDRFIDNVYHQSVPADIAENLKTHQPAAVIAAFLGTTRDLKTREIGGYYPTSTIPSAHVTWGVIFAYYAFRLRRKRWWVPAAAIALFSTLGTFILAQHYFVDVPAGIAAAALSILIASRLSNIDRERNLLQPRAATA
jgi:hypothetical protein